MSAALVVRSEKLSDIANDLFDANAFGDRGRFLGAINRLRQLLGEIDPSRIADLINGAVGWFGANPEFVAILKRLFGAITAEQLRAACDMAVQVQARGSEYETMPAAQVSLLCAEFSSLSADELHAAGILDNPAAWMGLVQAVLALMKMFRGTLNA